VRSLIFISTLFLFISCEETESCGINNYPGPPFGSPDDTVYYDSSVRYLYACYSGGFNKVVTFEIVGSCWEMYSSDEYNMNCD
tara:strand:+ start:197 stop:445 length:249 start_codon:yes stop_codon:yes gene_type:complete